MFIIHTSSLYISDIDGDMIYHACAQSVHALFHYFPNPFPTPFSTLLFVSVCLSAVYINRHLSFYLFFFLSFPSPLSYNPTRLHKSWAYKKSLDTPSG